MTVDASGLSVDEVRTGLREFFRAHPGIDEVRSNRDAESRTRGAGFDEGVWRHLVGELGILAIATPKTWDGLGLGLPYTCAVVEECGTALYPGPARASVAAACALSALDPDSVSARLRTLVGDFLAGDVIAGMSSDTGDVQADFADGHVHGILSAVTHGTVAGLVVAGVRTPDGPAVALIEIPHGTRRTGLPTVDLATPVADIDVADAAAVLITGTDIESRGHQRNRDMLLLAAEQVGGAQGCLSEMTAYAAMREQFGVVIGTYQAIQHRCADTAIAVAGARALVDVAANAHDGEDRSATALTLLARADASDAFVAAADALIQVSGGIGFTWEYDAHLYYRRARTSASLGGNPNELRDRAVEFGCLDLLTRPLGGPNGDDA